MNIEKIVERRKEYEKLQKSPFRIVAEMGAPFSTVCDSFPLDSLLAYAVMVDVGCGSFEQPTSEDELVDIPLPIVEIGTKVKYWAASWGTFEGAAKSMTTWKKRWDEENDDMTDAKRIDHKAGHFKQYSMPLNLISSPQIEWYGVGNIEEVGRLPVNFITHLGKKRGQGYGLVRKWIITPIDQDFSCWRDDTPQRCIPAAEPIVKEILDKRLAKGKGMYLHLYGYRPPYWAKKNQLLCLMPEFI